MPFSISSGQEYDLFGNAAAINTNTIGPNGPYTGADDDGDFELDEDITGAGNLYKGTLEINGVLYPVVTGSDGVTPDTNTLMVVVPDGEVTPTFPATFDFIPDVTQATYFYCFAEGTLIETVDGPRAVEELAHGDTVRTADGRDVAVSWVGRQTVNTRFAPKSALSLVRIAEGALGGGLPVRDLTVTADHALLVDGMLVTAGALVNETTIRRLTRSELPEAVTLYHVETEAHEVIVAEGAAAETFMDAGSRRDFDNYAAYMEVHGADRIIPEMDLPRVTSARLLPERLRVRFGIVEAALSLSA